MGPSKWIPIPHERPLLIGLASMTHHMIMIPGLPLVILVCTWVNPSSYVGPRPRAYQLLQHKSHYATSQWLSLYEPSHDPWSAIGYPCVYMGEPQQLRWAQAQGLSSVGPTVQCTAITLIKCDSTDLLQNLKMRNVIIFIIITLSIHLVECHQLFFLKLIKMRSLFLRKNCI